MREILDDLRYGTRLLRRNPGFSLAAILALALGIGANTAVFSVVDAVMLAPLPYADPDRLVAVWEDATFVGFPRNTPAPANWVDWQKRNTVFTDIAATRGTLFSITGDGPPEQVFARRVTANFWTVLGTQPLMGRFFTAEEDKTDAPLIVISHSLWTRRYGRDPHILGRKILLNGQPAEVIAVMPREFSFPSRDVDVWKPIAFTARDLGNRGSHFLYCVARLKPGVTLQQAQAAMTQIMKNLEQEHPGTNRQVGAVVVGLRDQIVGNTRVLLIALLCAAGCVLLIACANIANLLLARGSERRRELALRAAIGAGWTRLIRQLLTESLLLAGLGAVTGVLFARLGMGLLEKLVPPGLATASLTLDGRLLAFTLGIALLTGILFGVAPALAGAKLDLYDALKQGGRGAAGRTSNLMRDGLVVAQVSIALVLLTGAGLMIQTLYHLRDVDLGIRIDHLLTMRTFPSPVRYPDHRTRMAFLNQILEKVRALPGVVSAGYTSNLPLTTRGNTNGYILKGQSNEDTRGQDALFRVVSTDFLPTMNARLREGRFFNEGDREGTQPVVLVNETFADLHFPGRSALGEGVQTNFRGKDDPWLIIAGVVKEIRERGIDVDLKPAIYMPSAQSGKYGYIPGELAIRTTVDPESLVSAVRQAIWAIDREQPIARVRTMEEIAGDELSTRSQSMMLLGLFAALALVLASIGIYGVLSFMVLQRSREIAVRMAMGAQPRQVLSLVAGRGMGLTVIGLAIGIAGSLLATQLIQNILFGVRERDPWTMAWVSLILSMVAGAACLIPAFRAAGIDPVEALRND
jgi:predicted permease